MCGQDLEPRSYVNLPVGQTFLALGYVRSEGDLSTTVSSALQDAELTIESQVVGIAHTFALGGSSAKVDAVGIRSCLDGSGIFRDNYAEVDRCEYVDPRVKLTWNFFGAPAMSLEEFRKAKPGLVVGASLQLGIPVGTYHSRHLINAGANRWMIRPGTGLSYRLGKWLFDAQFSVALFEDNDNYFNGIKLERDPVYTAQMHIIYSLNKGRWISLNSNYYGGGETTKNGVKSDDELENSRLGVTYSMPLNQHHSIKLYASTTIAKRVGEDFDTFGVAWQYRM